MARLPLFAERVKWFNQNRPDLMANLSDIRKPGQGGRYMLSLLDEKKLRRVLARMLDPGEFLGDHGIRSLSRVHLENPYVFWSGNQEFRVNYLPAESDTGMFGGNSNWRGPIWAPINTLIIRGLLQMYSYYGDEFKVECPTGSGQYMNLYQVSEELANRMGAIYLRNHEGRRPVYGGMKKFADDPHWRDHLLFHEYFHGDNGAGLGASHQTGWTANIPSLMQLFAMITPEMLLRPVEAMAELGRQPGVARARSAPVNHPLLYQVNTRVFLQERGMALGRAATLDDVPDDFLDDVAAKGFTWVWFLGVWQTGADRTRGVAHEPGVARRVPSRAARLARPGHHRLAVRDHGLQGPRRLRWRHGAAPPAPAAGASRAQAAARLRAQSHRARSPLGHRAP